MQNETKTLLTNCHFTNAGKTVGNCLTVDEESGENWCYIKADRYYVVIFYDINLE